MVKNAKVFLMKTQSGYLVYCGEVSVTLKMVSMTDGASPVTHRGGSRKSESAPID